MKRLLDLFRPRPNTAILEDVERTNRILEQIAHDHRAATQRADKAMTESVEIAQDALRKRKGA